MPLLQPPERSLPPDVICRQASALWAVVLCHNAHGVVAQPGQPAASCIAASQQPVPATPLSYSMPLVRRPANCEVAHGTCCAQHGDPKRPCTAPPCRYADLLAMLASISPKFAVCRPLDYVPITPASLVLTNEYCGSPCGWLEEEGSRVS